MRTRIVPFQYYGIAIYGVQTRRWWWPFWTEVVTTTSLRDAQLFAGGIQST